MVVEQSKAKVALLPLFSVPVGVYNLSESSHKMNSNLITDIYKEKEKNPKGVQNSNFGGWHSEAGLEEKYFSFSELKSKIEECADHYCETFGFVGGLECFDLWANVSGPCNMNFPHHHSQSALAGVYYPIESITEGKRNFNYQQGEVFLEPGNWNRKDGGSFVVYDPSYSKKIHLEPGAETPYTTSMYHMYPTSGVLVLIPTYLIHTVIPFKEDKERVSISFAFHYKFDGEYGED